MPRDESWREPLEAREGLVTLGVLTQDEAMRAVFDSLPRITEARLLADRVIAGLGERAHHDVMAGPGNRLIFLRDAEDPRLILPEALLALDFNVAPPPPIQFPAFELPEESASYDFEYYVEVADAAQRRLAGRGDPFSPLTFRVAAKTVAEDPDKPKPWYQNPWVWVGIGAGAAAVTTGAIILATQKPTGTLPITIQIEGTP